MSLALATLPAAVTLAAVDVFCVRPHLRGRAAGPAEAAALDRQVARLREALRVLPAQNDLDGDPRRPGLEVCT